MHVAAIVLDIVLGAIFLMSGFMKFGAKQQVEAFKHYGYSSGFRIFTAVVEIVGGAAIVVGIWYAYLAAAAAIWLAVTMLVAAITHVRVKDPGRMTAVPVLFLLVAVVDAILNLAM